MSRASIVMAMMVVVWSGSAWVHAADLGQLLERARNTDSLEQRILLLDEALKRTGGKRFQISQAYEERGRAHKRLGDCFAAIRDFNMALIAAGKPAGILVERAECYIEVEQFDHASRDLERAILIRPGMPRAYLLKGVVYEHNGFLTKAEDEYTRALHYDEYFVPALEHRSNILVKQGKPREALQDMSAVARLERHRSDVFLTRARLYMKLGRFAEALEDLRRAERMAPGSEAVTKEIAEVYIRTGESRKALNVLAGLNNSGEPDVETVVLLARAHISMGNYLKAAQFLEEGAQKAPGNARVHLYQGMIADAQGEHDEALIHLNRALALDEDLTDAYKSRALIFVQLGDLVRADNDLSAAANLDASDGQIYSMRGQTRMARRLFEAAVKDFDKGLALLPGNVEILLWRATAFVHLHQMEAAFADLDTILEAQPDSPQALGLRGVVRYHLGETDQAKGDFARVVELDPDNPLLWNNRGFFLYKIGDYAEATRCFLRALTLRPGYDTAEYNLKLTRLRQGAATTGQASGNEATPSVGSGNEQSATGGNGP